MLSVGFNTMSRSFDGCLQWLIATLLIGQLSVQQFQIVDRQSLQRTFLGLGRGRGYSPADLFTSLGHRSSRARLLEGALLPSRRRATLTLGNRGIELAQ